MGNALYVCLGGMCVWNPSVFFSYDEHCVLASVWSVINKK